MNELKTQFQSLMDEIEAAAAQGMDQDQLDKEFGERINSIMDATGSLLDD